MSEVLTFEVPTSEGLACSDARKTWIEELMLGELPYSDEKGRSFVPNHLTERRHDGYCSARLLELHFEVS